MAKEFCRTPQEFARWNLEYKVEKIGKFGSTTQLSENSRTCRLLIWVSMAAGSSNDG